VTERETETSVMLNGWRYAPQTGQLSGEGEDQVLTGLTARVLNVLITHAPAPVSLEQFAQEAWKQAHLSEDTLAQRIAVLRKVLTMTPRPRASSARSGERVTP